MPAIAVAAGSHVFIYRHLRPYRRVSRLPVNAVIIVIVICVCFPVLVDLPFDRSCSTRD
jgi:hypothetical protein